MIRTQMFIAAALLAGVAIGYVAKPERSAAAEPPSEADRAVAALFADYGEEATIASLRSRISELERMLAEKESAKGGEEQKVEEEDRPRRRDERRGPPSMEEMRERFARMEREDPVRYAQMTNHFARMRQMRIERAQSKIEFLSSVDTSRMSSSAKRTHDDLQDLIARREELEAELHNPDIEEEDRRRIFEEMRRTDHEMRELNAVERDNLISQVALSMGLGEDDAVEVSETIKDILDVTDGQMQQMPPPPGPPPAE